MRFINLNQIEGETTINCRIYHFSYTQRVELIKYKMKVSGHFDEFRKDWLPMFENWTYGDGSKHLHPTTMSVWEDVKEYTGVLPYNL
jgi:hypothetical protein